VVHMTGAGILLAGGLCPLEYVPAGLCLLVVVWVINLYNFMDGMDGFAGGMSLFGFAFLASFGLAKGAEFFSLVALLLSASSLGFLMYNFPPAKLFMGDVGSVTLGYLVAGLSLWGIRDGIFSWWVPVLVFSPFFVDATVTLLRRLLKGEKVWQAHRSHYYQRLVRIGWGHKKTVIAEYLLMIATGFSAVLLEYVADTFLVAAGLVVWGGIYILLMIYINRLEQRNKLPT